MDSISYCVFRLQVRTKTEPTKWPILDSATHVPGNAPTLPPPPLIHSFAPLPMFMPAHPLPWQSVTSPFENLNPNVPEFVPVNLASHEDADGDASDAEEISETLNGKARLNR